MVRKIALSFVNLHFVMLCIISDKVIGEKFATNIVFFKIPSILLVQSYSVECR
jgi:hypothetical protein